MKNRTHRPTRVPREYAYATSAQGEFEIQRGRFIRLSNESLRQDECREALALAITAGERRITEVAGTEFEAGWRAAVDSLKAAIS